MATNSYGRLMSPPTHPSYTAEEQRDISISQSVETMPNEDADFIYDQRKQHQHQERLLTAYLKLIRKFDHLPKKVLLAEFQRALEHIYAVNKNREKVLAEVEKMRVELGDRD